MRRDATTNLRTRFEKIIKRAGLKPWPKLFQNLRSTRETELAESFPMHVVCEWLGNSQPVAAKHYLQVTDEHFERGAKSDAREAHNQAQQGGEVGRKETNEQNGDLTPVAASPGEISTSHGDSEPCTLAARNVRENLVGDEGLEPPTLSV